MKSFESNQPTPLSPEVAVYQATSAVFSSLLEAQDARITLGSERISANKVAQRVLEIITFIETIKRVPDDSALFFSTITNDRSLRDNLNAFLLAVNKLPDDKRSLAMEDLKIKLTTIVNKVDIEL